MGMHDYDSSQNQGSGGGFIFGLLAGAAIGAGIGMLLAPKSGAELREQLSGQANDLADKASQQYRRAAGAANDLASRGRDLYGSAREAVNRGAKEAQRYVRDTANTMSDEIDDISESASGSMQGSRS